MRSFYNDMRGIFFERSSGLEPVTKYSSYVAEEAVDLAGERSAST
jgi:hypothetical protein